MASFWLSRAPASTPIAHPITRKRSLTEDVRLSAIIAHLGMSYVLFEQKQFREALEICERAIYLDATSDAYIHKGYLLEKLGRVKVAQEAFKRARQNDCYE